MFIQTYIQLTDREIALLRDCLIMVYGGRDEVIKGVGLQVLRDKLDPAKEGNIYNEYKSIK